jgi:hypothetical protein
MGRIEMNATSLAHRLRLLWNWLRGKRIAFTDRERGRVMIRTGHNSANRDDGGQWYLHRYELAHGRPPLPRCCRGRLDDPVAVLRVERVGGEALARARRWYESRHGALAKGQALELVCVADPDGERPSERTMRYRPNETFEIESPWLSSEYAGPSFASYFGTWYGSGILDEEDVMDFEAFWSVGPYPRLLSRWGASWR